MKRIHQFDPARFGAHASHQPAGLDQHLGSEGRAHWPVNGPLHRVGIGPIHMRIGQARLQRGDDPALTIIQNRLPLDALGRGGCIFARHLLRKVVIQIHGAFRY